MTKRLFDIAFSLGVLVVAAPVILLALFLVWCEDGRSPIYRAVRVGRGNRDFVMVKIRSMRVGADRSGVNSTAASDARITRVGHFIRRFKLDELSQFWNVLKGDMSVVGPRPNTRKPGVDDYTSEECRLLSVRPGITDLSSIVFSDEGAILDGAEDADALYDQIIRPWKSRLALLTVDHATLRLELRIVWLTFLALFSKRAALAGVGEILESLGADPVLRRICRRDAPLPRGAPPGAELAA
jgi:lipopolysaccharide/colanic/teichoic acid biosynthesis glycosyltransferase